MGVEFLDGSAFAIGLLHIEIGILEIHSIRLI
jgi:hypothetical protein